MTAPTTAAGQNISELLTIITALKAPPAPPAPASSDKDSVTKVIIGGIVTILGAVVLALIFWVGTSVSDLSKSVTTMSANVDQLQKAIADLQQSQGTASQQLADGKATNARQDARADAIEADVGRIKERLRIVEGQKPLELPTVRPTYQ